MSDRYAPRPIEWFYRFSAVIGMTILFVLLAHLLMNGQSAGAVSSFPAQTEGSSPSDHHVTSFK